MVKKTKACQGRGERCGLCETPVVIKGNRFKARNETGKRLYFCSLGHLQQWLKREVL